MAKQDTAKRVLIAEAVLVGGGLLALFLKEFPGLVREIRIWRMGWRRKKK
ncbi:MAG: hypothetical protein M3308_05490 [Actinomycetota bacterium]|nr:hypothetical protein [Actinomycetota bacterium]